MLPEYSQKLTTLPRALTFVRVLEAFEGDILTEYRASFGSGLYLEKWCAFDQGVTRSLLVRTEQRAVAEYLGGRLPMLRLLTESSDGVGFIVDRRGGNTVAVYSISLSQLPPAYLPLPSALHDKTLRPLWRTVPQNFLLDSNWNAKLLASIEKRYLDAYGFAYLTQPGTGRQLPSGVLDYDYDGGFPIVTVYNRIHTAVPPQQRARSVGVNANSPGVLTIDAPSDTANHLADALAALPDSVEKYEAVHAWSRLSPTEAERIPGDALAHVNDLCSALRVDVNVLLPPVPGQRPVEAAVLVAGKLVAAYYRRLWRLLEPDSGVDFVSVSIPNRDGVVAPTSVFEEEETSG